MHLITFTSLLVPALSFASPLSVRQAELCAPTTYKISNFQYTSQPSGASIHFNFRSQFVDPSIIEDGSLAGATCSASAASGTIPNSNLCSTGTDLQFDLRAPEQNADFQIIHSWKCQGRRWMSGTRYKVDPLSCETDGAGVTTCSGGDVDLAPGNVRQICSTPTCP